MSTRLDGFNTEVDLPSLDLNFTILTKLVWFWVVKNAKTRRAVLTAIIASVGGRCTVTISEDQNIPRTNCRDI